MSSKIKVKPAVNLFHKLIFREIRKKNLDETFKIFSFIQTIEALSLLDLLLNLQRTCGLFSTMDSSAIIGLLTST